MSPDGQAIKEGIPLLCLLLEDKELKQEKSKERGRQRNQCNPYRNSLGPDSIYIDVFSVIVNSLYDFVVFLDCIIHRIHAFISAFV